MEINGLDCAKCQKSRKMDKMGIMRNVNENETKVEIVSSSPKFKTQTCRRCSGHEICDFRERESHFSLDLRSFRPSVLDGARSKVDIRDEGYAWTSIWWSSDNSKR